MAFMEELQHLKIQLEDIKLATDNFGDNNVIGIGGFGKVYKGELTHFKGNSMVALKRLDRKHGQGDPEFLKEIMLLSRYTHENLISLLGFCNEGDEKILVYEYASRGSLDRRLSDSTLTWWQRLKICLAAAKGLSYLHDPNTTHQRILHCDIKSSNILLDEHLNAKLSDFGLSKIGPANQKYTFLITNAIGTPGYCDPQYMETYTLTKESDVYSFGVVLFEVLCGRLCFEYVDRNLKVLVPMWKQKYKGNNLDEIIFQDLKQQMDPSSLKSFSEIAYQCLQKSREKRPSMARVLEKLEIALEYQELYKGKEQPRNSEQMINTVIEVPPQNNSAEEEPDKVEVKKHQIYHEINRDSYRSAGEHNMEMYEVEEQPRSKAKQNMEENVQPRFGEWDLNDPASAESYTAIFNRVRKERGTSARQELLPGTRDAESSRKGKSIWKKIFR